MSCDYVTLRAVYFCKEIFEYFGIIVPILLIILVSVDLGRMVLSSDADTKKPLKSIMGRVIAAIACYFVPIIVTLLVSILAESDDKMKNNGGIFCWREATEENVNKLKAAYEAEKKAEEQKRAAEKKKREDEKAALRKAARDAKKTVDQIVPTAESTVRGATVVHPYINGEEVSRVPNGACMTWEENCACPTLLDGKIPGFRFILKSETGREFADIQEVDGGAPYVTLKVKCSNGVTYQGQVHQTVIDKFNKAFEKVCQLQTTGINGVKLSTKDINEGGTRVKRLNAARNVCSPHVYGLAVDFNYGLSINVNGTSYLPFAGQGSATKQKYDQFVAALGGNEANVKNINYILWKYAFEPSGFEWGGTWDAGSFDPMHYEVRLR